MPFPWAVFIAIPATTAVVGSVVRLTGGPRLAKMGLVILGWNRAKGYRPGEGQFSDRPEGNSYYAVEANLDSRYDLNQGLGALAATLPVDFKPFEGAKFDMTLTESELLRSMLIPAVDALKGATEAKELYRAYPQEAEARHIAMEAYKNMRKAVQPVIVYLKQFPAGRIKKL